MSQREGVRSKHLHHLEVEFWLQTKSGVLDMLGNVLHTNCRPLESATVGITWPLLFAVVVVVVAIIKCN